MLTVPFSKAIVKLFTGSIKREDETIYTKTFLASDLFEADEYGLEYATKRDILYLDLGPAVQ